MKNQEWILAKWAEAWKEAGFYPKVLSAEDAKTHRKFDELDKIFMSWPSVNPKGYDAACLKRWVAMVQVGGGLMVDYDVLPYGFTSQAFQSLPNTKSFDALPTILCDKNPCPCAVYGTAVEFNNAVSWFVSNQDKCTKIERGQPHASDQTGVQSGAPWTAVDWCFQYGRDGWEKAVMVHYSHSACGGRPREQVIPQAEVIRAVANTPMPLKFAFSAEDTTHVLNGAQDDPPRSPTWIDQVRERVAFLKAETDKTDNNRTRVMQELKKNGLTPGGFKYAPKKKTKKRKLTGV
jgi:hypothetical protein